MRIYGFEEYGSADVARFMEVKDAELQPGSVLIRPKYIGVNPADIKVRNGQRTSTVPVNFPMAMGREATGVVIAVDPEHPIAGSLSVGDWVFGGTLAGTGAASNSLVLLDADQTAAVPEGVPGELVTSIPVAAGTAWDALHELRGEIGGQTGSVADKTLLIIGAGGGVGTHAIQLARHLGMKVIGATSTDSKVKVMQRYGARHVATSNDAWVDNVREIAAALPSGTVDAIFDLAGGNTLRQAAQAFAVPVRSVADPELAKEFGGQGVGRRRTSEVFAELAGLLKANEFTPRVTQVFDFDQADQAFRAVETGHAEGKIVIKVSG